jgi:hypothetical protein
MMLSITTDLDRYNRIPSLPAGEVLSPYIARLLEQAKRALAGQAPWPSARGLLRTAILLTIGEVAYQEERKRGSLAKPVRLAISQADELVLLPLIQSLVAHVRRSRQQDSDPMLEPATALGFVERVVLHTAVAALSELGGQGDVSPNAAEDNGRQAHQLVPQA